MLRLRGKKKVGVQQWKKAFIILLVLVCLVGGAILISIFAGAEPPDHIKPGTADSLPRTFPEYDVKILPGQSAAIDSWFINLNGGGWTGGILTIEISITNKSSRRVFAHPRPYMIFYY